MRFAPYSFSKISTYNTCPKKFDYQYVQKIGDIVLDSPALAKGRCIHSILEYYPEVHDDIKNNEYYEIAREICDKFIKSNLGHYVTSDKPKFAEQKIALDYNLEPCDYKSKNVLFKGIVDQVLIDLELHLSDFKSGKYVDFNYQSFDQLMFYAIYFFKKYSNIKVIHISYLYVEHNMENKIKLEREYFNNYLKQLLVNIKTIEDDFNFNHKFNDRLCNWCSFNVICEKYKKEKEING